jgi:isopenicillin N synthase-like dioxygenase
LDELDNVFSQYKSFFKLPLEEKNKVNMSFTSSNRGWGGIKTEQVNYKYNADYKEIFDCGPNIEPGHKFEDLTYYSMNKWPPQLPLFEKTITSFYSSCSNIALSLLKQIELCLNFTNDYFSDKFILPMSLLRCNYYPRSNLDLSQRDYGIAPHTDYGCLTLLFSDGIEGLEIENPAKEWEKVTANKDEIIINFGDMLEIWSNKKIKATKHRVLLTNKERFSIPFFFNPQYDTVISKENNLNAGKYLSEKYNATYLHKKRI